MKKIVLALVLMLITCSYGFAATGCQYTSGYIYIKSGGSGGGSGIPNYTYSGAASERVLASGYCVVVTGGANSCYINVPSSPSTSAYGVLVNYSALPCPIDSNTYLLLIATAGLSYYFLRNRQII